jgi:hypothetical protein
MDLKLLIEEAIEQYIDMREFGQSMYFDTMAQYRDMAMGGDGGDLGFWPDDWAEIAVNTRQPVITPTCRSYNYPNYPDSFFQRVLKGLGETSG